MDGPIKVEKEGTDNLEGGIESSLREEVKLNQQNVPNTQQNTFLSEPQ